MEAKRDTKSVGDRSEMEVLHALYRAGYGVFVPLIGENRRYDLIADDGEKVARVQVKTGRLRDGAIVFNGYSAHAHRGGPSCRSYVGQIEYFGVYSPELDRSYLIPMADMAPFSGSLRVRPPRNGQGKRIRWARDYEIQRLRPLQVGPSAGLGVLPQTPELPL